MFRVTTNKRDLGTFCVSRCIPSTCSVLFDYYVVSVLGAKNKLNKTEICRRAIRGKRFEQFDLEHRFFPLTQYTRRLTRTNITHAKTTAASTRAVFRNEIAQMEWLCVARFVHAPTGQWSAFVVSRGTIRSISVRFWSWQTSTLSPDTIIDGNVFAAQRAPSSVYVIRRKNQKRERTGAFSFNAKSICVRTHSRP